LHVRQLLTKGIPFGRDPADNTMSSSQLLHHHIEVAIQRAERGIVRRARQRGGGVFLLSTRSLESAGATVGFLAGKVDDKGFGGRCGRFGSRRGTVRQLVFTNAGVIERRGDFVGAWRPRALTCLSAS